MAESTVEMPFEFEPKRWTLWFYTIFHGVLCLFSLGMGPLFATGLMKNARGAAMPEAGFMMIAVGLLTFLPTFLVCVNRLRMNRGFLLKICREGLVYKQAGLTKLDRIPLMPGVIRVWARLFTGAAYQCHYNYIPWSHLENVEITGIRGAQCLRIDHQITGLQFYQRNPVKNAMTYSAFRDADFNTPLQKIAESIQFYRANSGRNAQSLPSWFEFETFSSP